MTPDCPLNSPRPVSGTVGYFKITVFGFGLAALWSCLHSVIIPLRLLDFVVESEKNTYLGLLTFTGLLIGMAVQPVSGMMSDRSAAGWGRRRPYIVAGAVLALFFLPGIGLATGYATIFIAYCGLQLAGNTAQGPYQGLIPDMVPAGKRGVASGVNGLLEVMGGVSLLYPVALFMDRYSGGGDPSWLWLVLAVLGSVLIVVTLATLLAVREKPGAGGVGWRPLSALRLSFRIDIKKDRDFVFFLISRLFVLMAFTTIQTFALYFIRDVVGVTNPAAAVARFSIVAVIGMVAVVYPAGRLSDRVGRRPVAMAAGLLGALGILLLLFLHGQGPVVLNLCGGLLGIAYGAFMSANWALATDLVAVGNEARYLGLTNLASAGAAALARLIGPLIDFLNTGRPGSGYLVMLLACFVYFTVGSALLLTLRRTPQPR